MSKQITCKVHDNEQRVIEIGVEGEGVKKMLDIWQRIRYRQESFHTEERNRRTNVKAVGQIGFRRYLTTHPDGVTDNNLDELRLCY